MGSIEALERVVVGLLTVGKPEQRNLTGGKQLPDCRRSAPEGFPSGPPDLERCLGTRTAARRHSPFGAPLSTVGQTSYVGDLEATGYLNPGRDGTANKLMCVRVRL